MPKLILNQKVKYKGVRYPVNEDNETVSILVDEKDVSFFEEHKMISKASGYGRGTGSADSNDVTAKNLIKMIEQSENVELLQDTLSKELEGKQRKTVIDALETKLEEIEAQSK